MPVLTGPRLDVKRRRRGIQQGTHLGSGHRTRGHWGCHRRDSPLTSKHMISVMPNLAGQDEAAATATLTEGGISAANITTSQVNSGSVAKGLVVSTKPAFGGKDHLEHQDQSRHFEGKEHSSGHRADVTNMSVENAAKRTERGGPPLHDLARNLRLHRDSGAERRAVPVTAGVDVGQGGIAGHPLHAGARWHFRGTRRGRRTPPPPRVMRSAPTSSR